MLDELAVEQIRIPLNEVLEALRVPALAMDGHEVQPCGSSSRETSPQPHADERHVGSLRLDLRGFVDRLVAQEFHAGSRCPRRPKPPRDPRMSCSI